MTHDLYCGKLTLIIKEFESEREKVKLRDEIIKAKDEIIREKEEKNALMKEMIELLRNK